MKRNETRFTVIVHSVLGRQSIDERRVVVRTLGDTWFVFSLAGWAEHMKLPSLNFRFKRNLVKVRHLFEGMKTIVDLSVRETPDTVSAKLLDIKRSHH